jgi:hypothetical protein
MGDFWSCPQEFHALLDSSLLLFYHVSTGILLSSRDVHSRGLAGSLDMPIAAPYTAHPASVFLSDRHMRPAGFSAVLSSQETQPARSYFHCIDASDHIRKILDAKCEVADLNEVC